MVHTVVGRRDEEPLEPAQFGNVPGVHPELIQQVQRSNGKEYQRRHANQRHRQVEDPAEDEAGTGLPQRGGKVVVLTLVMHRMRSPEHIAFMAQTVVPVVTEVVEDEGKQPDPQAAGRQLEHTEVLPGQGVSE